MTDTEHKVTPMTLKVFTTGGGTDNEDGLETVPAKDWPHYMQAIEKGQYEMTLYGVGKTVSEELPFAVLKKIDE